VLRVAEGIGLLRGQTVGFDAMTLEANALRCSPSPQAEEAYSPGLVWEKFPQELGKTFTRSWHER